MTLFKCKMCGATLSIEPGQTTCECDSCFSVQTLPRIDDDRKANLYDRANHFRRNNDFDKAAGIYEQILSEDITDAEVYWSLVLCRYGVEYVDDPMTHKRIPTVNRTQYTSVFDDENYKQALKYADVSQKIIYEQEAKAINEIQKGILEISQKEDPFDVFICYKETDATGRRTPDSVLANDLYHLLIQEGFKVFFSRITLEDKLGTAYEPYIFAALNSAKVMVVLGTRKEYFDAVWVKNEWSRYLSLVKQSGGKKALIPAYKDMDPYDLPDEFSHLQAQDMSKLGFMQDLIRGIKKIVNANESNTTVNSTTVISGNTNIAPLLKRAFMFLEDKSWRAANEYCEKVLDQDPENAQAYLGKLMSELHVSHQEDLMDCKQPFDHSANFRKAIRFGDKELSFVLSSYIEHINERNENARLTNIYDNAVNAMNAASSEDTFKSAAEMFKTISGFKDSDELIKQCLEKAEICHKDSFYSAAKSYMAEDSIRGFKSAINRFCMIPGWKDADEQINICQRRIEELKAKQEAERLERERKAEADRLEREQKAEAERLENERKEEERRMAAEKAAKKRKRTITIFTAIIAACVAFAILLTTVIIPKQKYNAVVAEYGQEFVDTFNALNEGDVYKFGTYEQDNNTANGKEDIEWLILAKKGNRILIISRYALDCKQYNTSYDLVKWEKCSLRKWLNGTFLNTAFSENERAIIPSVSVSADKNPNYSTKPGNSTKDQIFLLSVTEANKYFSSDYTRQCQGTAYCYAQNYKFSNGNVDWWLRSPGSDSYRAARVNGDGSVLYQGGNVNFDDYAVRPALWIDLGF